MTTSNLIAEVTPEIVQGNVALWLGPDWNPPDTASANPIAAVSWLAVWSESTDSGLGLQLRQYWPTDPRLARRVPVEVPGRLADALGSYFSLSEICPIFYLAGRADSWRELVPREQRRARDEQIDVIARLNGSVLVLTGFSTADQVVALVRDEFPSVAVRILVVGLPQLEQGKLREVGFAGPAFLGEYGGGLRELVAEVEGRVLEVPPRPRTIKVGSGPVDLGPLFEREHPIDQDFLILTTEAIRPPDPSEDRGAILEEFVAGRSYPWRAFAHNLHWRRDADHWTDCLRLAKDAVRPGGATAACLNLPGETGSGLTTFVQELGFRLAEEGYPVLALKTNVTHFDYETLRIFLEHISQGQPQQVPAVLIIDDADFGFDGRKGTSELLNRLARDGRHVLLLRSVPVRSGGTIDESFRREKGVFARQNERILEHWAKAPLRAALNALEQASLVSWTARQWGVNQSAFAETIRTWGADWPLGGEPPPLLVCLYALLRDRVTSATDFGRHLFGRLKHLYEATTKAEPEEAEKGTGRRPLSSSQLAEAVAQLQQHFRAGAGPNSLADGGGVRTAAPREAANLTVALAVFGCLRVPAPRAVLEQVTGLSGWQMNRGLVDLEKTDLVTLSLGSSDASSDLLARRAFYTDTEVVGFRHPVMGRLLLDWLLAGSSADAAAMSCDLVEEIAADYGGAKLPSYPIRLLKPLLRRLRPSQSISGFVDEVTTRFLRLQRVRGSDYHRWQWTDQSALLEVLSTLPEAVARQSAVVLHTRGLTRYKSCSPALSLAECRVRYEAAETDLRLAVERAQESPYGEKPAHIVTSHGLLYQGWARQEAERGSPPRASELRELARQYLREGLRLGGERENPYAAFGLAGLLVEECERYNLSSHQEFASRLSEALDLLQGEPDDSFEVEWLELKQRAIQLLDSDAARRVVSELTKAGDELGTALEALRVIGGDVPTDGFPGDVQSLTAAWRLLTEKVSITKKSALASLLRYAIYSAMPERAEDPQFERRYELVRQLEGTSYLDRPLWLFDYGMLALQTGQIRVGSDAFRRLRSGGRFLEVPLERARYLSEPDRPLEPRVARFRVVRLDDVDRGWAKITDPVGFSEPVPFTARLFRSAGSPTSVGATMVGRLRIRPSGLSAEPLRSSDSRSR